MEPEKQLNSAESIAIIERMIAVTREKYEKGGGTILLIWGYTSVFISALVILVMTTTTIHWVHALWWLIPITGYSLMLVMRKKHPRHVRTYIDKIISHIWIVIGTTVVIFPLAALLTKNYEIILPVEALVVSLGVTLTGLAIRFRPSIVAGALAIALSMFMLLYGNYIWIFIAIFIVTMVVPGHILNRRGNVQRVRPSATL